MGVAELTAIAPTFAPRQTMARVTVELRILPDQNAHEIRTHIRDLPFDSFHHSTVIGLDMLHRMNPRDLTREFGGRILNDCQRHLHARFREYHCPPEYVRDCMRDIENQLMGQLEDLIMSLFSSIIGTVTTSSAGTAPLTLSGTTSGTANWIAFDEAIDARSAWATAYGRTIDEMMLRHLGLRPSTPPPEEKLTLFPDMGREPLVKEILGEVKMLSKDEQTNRIHALVEKTK